MAVCLYPNPLREAHINKHSIQVVHRAVVASNLARIADAVCDAPDFDRAGVDAARDALARGDYEINAERIAEGLLQFDAPLDDRGRPRRG